MGEERLLPDWIDSFCKYVHNSEPPDSFKRWVAISVVASCLQRKCYLQWEGALYPNLYIVLVGPSGCRKGTAMRPGQRFLRKVGIKMSPEAVTREQLIRRLKKSSDQSVTEDRIPILHASLTIFSEELTVFLGYNSQQLMADLCDWYDCGDVWNYETKNAGQDNIVNIWVNLMGATTPRLLQTTLPQDAVGGGLTSRIIFIYEQRKGKTVTRPFMTKEGIELEGSLLHDLEAIKMMRGDFIPTEEYLDKYEAWYDESEKKPPFIDYRFEGYVSRRSTHLRKISMVMSASRSNDMQLTGVDFDCALQELLNAEKKMGDVFKGVGRSDLAGVTRSVMATIARMKVVSFNELLGIHHDDATHDEMSSIINTLTMIEKDGKRFCKWKDISKRIIEYIE